MNRNQLATVTLATVIARMVEHGGVVVGDRARLTVWHYCKRTTAKCVQTIEDDEAVVEMWLDEYSCNWEWLIRLGGVVKAHSNAGYGSKASCLREALMFCEYGQWR